MAIISILIADDHQLVRDAWTLILNNDPRFNVVAGAALGEQAVELAKNLQPDIVLMDINMSDLSGFEATKLVRKYSPHTKVIGVSMHSMPVYAKKMINMGAAGYVTKNSSKEELFQAIVEVMNGKIFICSEVKNILARQKFEPGNNLPDINMLSKRELEIAQLIKSGLSSGEIAKKLDLSCKTVEVHRYNILKKLILPNSAALVNFVNQNAL